MTSSILAPTSQPAPEVEAPVLVVVETGRFLGWLLSLLPVWEVMSREEAAREILARDVHIRYSPLIVELDRK